MKAAVKAAVKAPRIVMIGGPTAAGKSTCALALALALDAEIVSADSVQVYRGFDIGSAKPSASERARVRHHLIDCCGPSEVYSAARFVADADLAIADIAARGRPALVVGGTGLYLRSLVRGLFEVPSDPVVRQRLRDEAARGGLAAMHRRLTAIDPGAAERISENDPVRVVRALEVAEISGRPISELQAEHGLRERRYDALCLTLSRSKASRDRRIADRAGRMLAAGLVEEVEGLLASGVSADAPPMATLGYHQVRDVLLGRAVSEGLAERIHVATRRFAKRQLTWFRGQWESRWFDLDREESAGEIIDMAGAWFAGAPSPVGGATSDAWFRD